MTAVSDTTGGGDRLPPDEDVWVFPTSFPQRRMWVVEQLAGGGPLHNIPVLLRLVGRLDAQALERALNAVVARHEMLRTSFVPLDGEPAQVVSASVLVPLRRVDLSGEQVADRAAIARRMSEQDCDTPFDLTCVPLLRACLYTVGEGAHLLSLVMHHIITDGWSMGVLVREIATAYEVEAGTGATSLPDLPIQYGDFAHWQRQTMRDTTADRQLAFWTRTIGGDLPLLELPTDRPRPAVRSTSGAQHRLTIPGDLAIKVRKFAAGEGATPFMALLAAFTALLHHYTDETDIVVGSPVAGRTRAEVEPLIGFFVNTVVLRTDVSGNPGLRELVHRVRKTTADALAHQDVPFELLVERLSPARSLSHTPLFQVMFEFGNAPMPELTLPGLVLTPVPVERVVAEFDLSLSIMDSDGDLTGVLEYCTDMFEPETVARFAEHYLLVLGALVHEPDTPVGGVDLLSAADRASLPHPGDAAAVRQDRVLTDLLRAAENLHTDRPALICGGQEMTYRRLAESAAALGARLTVAGAVRDGLVVVCLRRSIHLGIAIRAVLSAGSAFVPVDPGEPDERLHTILRDARPACVVVDESTVARIPPGPWQVVRADHDTGAPPLTSSPGRPGPHDAAYAIYTSGSTGTPKGAVISHSAAADYCIAFRDRLRLRPEDRFLQFAALGFDVLVEEILPIWTAGGTVVLPDTELFLSYDELTDLLAEAAVSVAELPTAYWHEWVRHLVDSGRRPPADLRALIIGGERVSAERLEQWSAFGIRLLHVFGLTETTVTSTVFDAGTTVPAELVDNLPIGTPLANTTLHVLNRYLAPVPPGVPGELYIGGTGLARGYLGRPAMTAARFVADPFTNVPGARLYRTGDLVRRDVQGRLRFLGRVDEQVKIRGYRVEPGEIETTLREHDQVSDAVVSVESGRLVVHVVPLGTAAPSAAALSAYLRARLPEHMVPGHYDLLDRLPLTHNGKIDDRALAVRAGAAMAPGRATGATPRTPLEEQISAIWRELLGMERVDRDVNFFDVGGHSLLAARLQARLSGVLGREVPLIELFKRPTVASQAALGEDNPGPAATAGDNRKTARTAAAGRQDAARARRRAGRTSGGAG